MGCQFGRATDPAFVAQPESIERTDCKELSIRSPRHRHDGVVVRVAAVELTAVGVPDTVLAVFSAGQDEIVDGVPVHLQDHTIMGFPLEK